MPLKQQLFYLSHPTAMVMYCVPSLHGWRHPEEAGGEGLEELRHAAEDLRKVGTGQKMDPDKLSENAF